MEMGITVDIGPVDDISSLESIVTDAFRSRVTKIAITFRHVLLAKAKFTKSFCL